MVFESWRTDMEAKKITDNLYVASQLTVGDVAEAVRLGIKSVIVNRPDGESGDQPTFVEIREAARQHGINAHYLPVSPGAITDTDVEAFSKELSGMESPVLGYCRSGMRTISLWALSQSKEKSVPEILSISKSAGFDLSGIAARIANGGSVFTNSSSASHEIVIIGAGAAGISAAASILSRVPSLDVAIIDPANDHYYQPGWTLVGAGIFSPERTRRKLDSLIPSGAKLIRAGVVAFDPANNAVILEGCRIVKYRWLVVAPGLKLDWAAIDGLPETLGKNGVTSNYRYDLAPYTWSLVKGFKGGRALFTQPPMPIKCAGAPQKAMYLSCDTWLHNGVLRNTDVEFLNAGPVLFGVADYVPPLMKYVEKYTLTCRSGTIWFVLTANPKLHGLERTTKTARSNWSSESSI